MSVRKSKRQPKPRIIWEEKQAPPAVNDLKITEKTARTEKKTALKPVVTGPLPEATVLTKLTFRSYLRTNHHLICSFKSQNH
jgi:hypothetical protein